VLISGAHRLWTRMAWLTPFSSTRLAQEGIVHQDEQVAGLAPARVIPSVLPKNWGQLAHRPGNRNCPLAGLAGAEGPGQSDIVVHAAFEKDGRLSFGRAARPVSQKHPGCCPPTRPHFSRPRTGRSATFRTCYGIALQRTNPDLRAAWTRHRAWKSKPVPNAQGFPPGCRNTACTDTAGVTTIKFCSAHGIRCVPRFGRAGACPGSSSPGHFRFQGRVRPRWCFQS